MLPVSSKSELHDNDLEKIFPKGFKMLHRIIKGNPDKRNPPNAPAKSMPAKSTDGSSSTPPRSSGKSSRSDAGSDQFLMV